MPKDLSGQGIIHKVEQKYPGSSKIFNALFWLPLKGKRLTQEEITGELDNFRDEFSYAPEPMLTIDYWRTEIDRTNSSPAELFIDFIGVYDCEDITLQAVVLMLAWADTLDHHDTWNFTCDAYRELLPTLIIGIDWPFKNEIFDAVDQYARKRSFPNGIRRIDSFKSWRSEIPKLQLLLGRHYAKLFKLRGDERLKKLNYIKERIPRHFWEELAYIVTAEICKREHLFFNSKYLWKYILDESINLIRKPHIGNVTTELLMGKLKDEELLSFYIQKHQKAELIIINELLATNKKQ